MHPFCLEFPSATFDTDAATADKSDDNTDINDNDNVVIQMLLIKNNIMIMMTMITKVM